MLSFKPTEEYCCPDENVLHYNKKSMLFLNITQCIDLFLLLQYYFTCGKIKFIFIILIIANVLRA